MLWYNNIKTESICWTLAAIVNNEIDEMFDASKLTDRTGSIVFIWCNKIMKIWERNELFLELQLIAIAVWSIAQEDCNWSIKDRKQFVYIFRKNNKLV